jgi:hypothetical protein
LDDRQFDHFTKVLSDATGSRRNALKLLAGTATAALGLPAKDGTISARHNDRKHRNERRRRKDRKRCGKKDSQCNLNTPSECCSRKCCFDSTSKSRGTCPSRGGECCGDRPFGGYCPVEFPQCCGSNACCGSTQSCCVSIGGRGICCNPGFECSSDGSGCVAAQTAEITAVDGSGGIPRMHAGL